MAASVDPAAACFASEMNAALGRYDEYIDIRDPDVFATWQSTPGLRCLVCRHPVSVYRSSAKNPFVRHGKGNASKRDPKVAKSARETFMHERLKHWVCAELRRHGSTDAHVETRVDNRQPDVFGHIGNRGYAVEVQWSPLSKAQAEARTRDMLAGGADAVLWLTQTCAWVEQLPALGIKSFDPDGDDYWAHTGFLTYRPGRGMVPTQVSVREALRAWVAGELAWAYQNHRKAGWARVTDWEQHTRSQAEAIARKNVELARVIDERDKARQEVKAAKATIARNVDTITEQANTIDKALAHRKELETKIVSQNAELAAAHQAQAEEDQLRQVDALHLTQLTTEVQRLEAAIRWRKVALFVLLTLCVVLAVALLLS